MRVLLSANYRSVGKIRVFQSQLYIFEDEKHRIAPKRGGA